VFCSVCFGKKATAPAAYLTLIAGAVLAAVLFPLDFSRKELLSYLGQNAPAAHPAYAWICQYILKDFMLDRVLPLGGL